MSVRRVTMALSVQVPAVFLLGFSLALPVVRLAVCPFSLRLDDADACCVSARCLLAWCLSGFLSLCPSGLLAVLLAASPFLPFSPFRLRPLPGLTLWFFQSHDGLGICFGALRSHSIALISGGQRLARVGQKSTKHVSKFIS